MNVYVRGDAYFHAFLTLALAVGEWSASRPGRFTHGERHSGTHWIGGWVRDGLDMGKINS
jgi:hypothetical protein